MKLKKYITSIFFLIVILSACEKEKVEDNITGEYLVSRELISSYTKDQVITQLTIGSLLYPEVSSLIDAADYGIKIYKVTYNTTFLGEPIIASGLISIPNSGESFPVVSFQNGTNTCNSNAPSVDLTDPFFLIINYMASNGYVFCIPDYVGFGASKDKLHLYMHRESSNQAVSDLLRAMVELIEQESSAPTLNNTLYLMGYSQGGWATLSALEDLENNPAGDLTVSAAACGAGSYDLLEMSDYIFGLETYPNPFYMPYFIESRRQNNILTEPITTYFNSPYAEEIPSLFDGVQCNSTINDQLNDTISVLLSSGLTENINSATQLLTLKDELESNSVSAWETSASIRFFHSKGDKSIPHTQTESIYTDFEFLGADVNIVQIDSLDHTEAAVTWGVDAMNWLNSIK